MSTPQLSCDMGYDDLQSYLSFSKLVSLSFLCFIVVHYVVHCINSNVTDRPDFTKYPAVVMDRTFKTLTQPHPSFVWLVHFGGCIDILYLEN